MTGHTRYPSPARRRPDGHPSIARRALPAAVLGLALALTFALVGTGPASAQEADALPALAPDPESGPAGTQRPAEPPSGGVAGLPSAVRGLLEPPAEAVLSSGIAGRIEALPLREGDRFAAGDLLARFDCALYEARLAAAEAEALKARRQLANDRQLASLNSIGRLEVGLAEAELARAEAEVGVTALLVERCRLPAPFDGRVVDWRAEPFETVGEGTPILEIVASGAPEVALIVPSRWLAWLGEGQPFAFTVDETGTRHAGTVTRLGARVDPASQTVRVTGRLDAAAQSLIPGMSGTARFDDRPGG